MIRVKGIPPLWKASLASFSVYLLPLVGPHAIWLWGEVLFPEIVGKGERREALWIAADLGLALVLQVAAGLLFYWFFQRPGWRRLLVLGAAVPVFFITVQRLYLVAIPAYFLIERDIAAEQGEWTVECTIPNASLASVRAPLGLTLEQAGEAWLIRIRSQGLEYAILRMPGCDVTELDLTWTNVGGTPSFVLPGGAHLANSWDKKTARQDWWYSSGPRTAPVRLKEPPNHSKNDGLPILSEDGEWVAWVIREPDSGEYPTVAKILIQHVRSPEEKMTAVSLKELGPGGYVLLDLDMQSREVTVSRNLGEFLRIGLDGRVRWGPLKPETVKPHSQTFRRVGRGWVAWDAYKERDAYFIAWSLPHATGSHRVLKGRSITSVAVDPAGRFIAVSVSGSYSIGNVQDAVYVLRVADGTEVFRRYLPRYTRTQVAFLGRQFFAYSAQDEVRVLRLPDQP